MAELISMTDFVLRQYEEIQNSSVFETNCFKYATLLKQPLEKWQFVPSKLVNGVWVVLEEPNINEFKSEPFCSAGNCKAYQDELKDYEQAKLLCLFEGFEYSDIGYWYINTQEKGMLMFDEENIENQTIEDLVKYKLTLTPAAEKQIGL